jgi:hypothetical protein
VKSLRRPLTLESLDAREAPALLSIAASGLNYLANQTNQPVDSTGNPLPPTPPPPGTGQTPTTPPAPGNPTPPPPPAGTPT